MLRLEDLQPGSQLEGVLPGQIVTIEKLDWLGSDALSVIYRDQAGKVASCMLFREAEARLSFAADRAAWRFDGNGATFRLVAEAQRIRLAHLFDPLLAVHTSLVDPLPHQITAVYEAMLPRQPLRFLLADDPGAGKTIMTGILIKELIARGDLQRCLIICPGNLVEQWQDELDQRFQLPFEILTNDKLNAARGNWFLENDLVIARLDKLARDEEAQAKLLVPENRYDLVVIDEAHKCSASFFGGEVRYTKRYRLAQQVSGITRHLLLLTATPHNGKEADFQLFLALLDQDRFEGRFREGVHQVDVSDIMRRMVKEDLVTFDGKPLFPERIAETIQYKLSPEEMNLYEEVTRYVRQEFDRADALNDDQRAGTVGFALTILQRRLASSPEAIYQSLRRRRERLEARLRTLNQAKVRSLDLDDLEALEDAPEDELVQLEHEVLDQATAARTAAELEAEIKRLAELERLAERVRISGQDTKWRELSALLDELFNCQCSATSESPRRKLVIFTEHRDTLTYLQHKIAGWFGGMDILVTIHGGMDREQRKQATERFLYEPNVCILIATDAAGEGINLQRAHLMINYDLPWNPNRIEQRFGRIHRIGQTEVCRLWNLVAVDTREGDVYHAIFRKLEEARQALGGKVYDVLGRLVFDGRSLRDLLIEAIRYGDQPDVRMNLSRVIDKTVDVAHLRTLLEERALAHDAMDTSRLLRVRDEMARAEALRLQPHYIESFFLEALKRLEGSVYRREPGRYEISYIPPAIHQAARRQRRGASIPKRYERICFDKSLINLPRAPLAAFICPGHPLLEALIDLTLDAHGHLLRQGAILVDERDTGTTPRVLFFLDHTVRDANQLPSGEARIASRRMLYAEMYPDGQIRPAQYAPYLDYRPLLPDESSAAALKERPELAWITPALEAQIMRYAAGGLAQAHLREVQAQRSQWVEKTRRAVHDRLTKEISYWDRRAEELRAEERAGKVNAKLNSQEARRRANELEARLKRRMAELDRELQLSADVPVIAGCALIVPAGLLAAIQGRDLRDADDTQAVAARAREIVMEVERKLGYLPRDCESERLGYDIESRDPNTGRLRFIEVKGRLSGAQTITVTRNEILTALNKPDDYILAIVEFLDDGKHRVRYLRQPFCREPDFGATSVNYNFAELLARASEPA
jgi:superfamily II DNA or RNA helicase